MIDQLLADLSRELAAVGIRGRLRRRILLETEDHLRSGPDGIASFGAPKLVARRFADELATIGSRRAANATFLALAVAAIVYTVALLPDRGDLFAADLLAVALPAAILLVLAPQLALVAGVLALLRSFRRRAVAIAPAAEVRLVRRQTLTALAAGWVTVASLAAYAGAKGAMPSWWLTTALGSCGIAALALTWASVRFARTVGLRPRAGGPSGDAFDDLEVLAGHVPGIPRVDLRRHPWLFCIAVAVAAALAAFMAAAAGGQPDEGLRNAVVEAGAVCLGFAAFGAPLGLRPSR